MSRLPSPALWLTVALVVTLVGACATSDQPRRLDGAVHDGPSADLPPVTDGGPDLRPPDQGPASDATGDMGSAKDTSLTDANTTPTFEEVQSFGTNPGQLRMYLYTPAQMPAAAPLIVVLHPCQIGAESFGKNAGWHRLADLRKAYVLYPEQKVTNNLTTCFNWFEPGDQVRDSGEAASIKQMIDKARTLRDIDAARIYVAGLSAGGAMAAALLAGYPDVFAGGAIFAGVPAGCASSVFSATSCMLGSDKTPSQWATLGHQAYPGYTGGFPRVSIFQGLSDIVVSPSNLDELIEQWTALHATDATADATTTINGNTREVYRDGQGKTVVTAYRIPGMPHGVPVDPGTGPTQGGQAGIGYYDVDLWGAWQAAEDWGL